MSREDQKQSWAGLVQYPGKRPCWFGTVLARIGAPMHEVEAALWEAWGEVFPADIPKPALVRLEPGAIFFVPEKAQ